MVDPHVVVAGRWKQRNLPRAGLALGAALVIVAGGWSCGSSNGDKAGGSEALTEEFGMTEAQLVSSIEAVESRIASCMSDGGFEYIPIDPVTLRDAMAALGTAPGLSDEEFVDQFGYGITTLPPTRAFGAGEENARIREDLDPTDQVAYDRTLLGDTPDATFMITLDTEDFSSTGGCTRAAVEEAFNEAQLSPTYLNPIDALVEQDPRMIAAREKWADCMREEAYDYPRQEDAEDELGERLAVITEGADPATLTGSAKDALAELQGEERAIALVDLDCSERFLDDVEEEVERDITGREPK